MQTILYPPPITSLRMLDACAPTAIRAPTSRRRARNDDFSIKSATKLGAGTPIRIRRHERRPIHRISASRLQQSARPFCFVASRPCLFLRSLLPRRLWRFGAPVLNYHPWFRRREPCLSINYTCKRITNWQNQTISSKSGRETLKRRPRRKKRGSASSSPPIHLRLRWNRSKSL